MIDTILTCGTFDLFHQGHLNLLLRCKKMGKKLVVGVSSDFFNIEKKNRLPISPLHARYKLISELKCVDQVFIEDDISLEAKARYMQYYAATIFVIGDDWFGKFDDLPYVYEKLFPTSKFSISVIYLPRTPFISTTDIINKFNKKSNKYNQIDYKKSMLPHPSPALLNTSKLPYKVIFNCRNRGHQAVHLLPYYHLFEKENVYWYIENATDEYSLNKVLQSISSFIGFDLDRKQIITKVQDVVGLSINIAMFTELWKPIVLSYKAIGIKVYFIDHGICVGTRHNSWFANVWQNDVDKIIVSGQMQYDHHKYCSKLPECHSQPEENIYRLYGYPKFSLYSPCEWIWNMNNINSKNNLKRILIAPTSFYDNYSFIYNNIVNMCKNNIVVIRPHPDTMEMANPFGELFKIFIKCLDEGCAENLIIIPPSNNFLTMNLFTCDIAIFDQSSVAYEYLLVDKPGLISSLKLEENVTKDIRNALAQVDQSTYYDIGKIEFILRDPLHLKEKRKRMRDYVFGGTHWVENFVNLVNHDMMGIDLDNVVHVELPENINYEVDNNFYNNLRPEIKKDNSIDEENKQFCFETEGRNVNININLNVENCNKKVIDSLIDLVGSLGKQADSDSYDADSDSNKSLW